MPTLPEVVELAEQHLAPLGDWWLHTQAVGGRAAELSVTIDGEDRHLLAAAAWLHDIGYGHAQRDTGLHPLDGARWLAAQGYPRRLCALVVHHSAATYEAEQRGLSDALSAWPHEASAVNDALWVADMSTGPAGQRMTYPERLAEILHLPAPGSAVAVTMTAALPAITAAVARGESRLAQVREAAR